MKTRFIRPWKLLVLTWVLTALITPSPSDAAVTITSKFTANITNGLNPADAAWNSAVQSTVPLDSIIGPTGVPQLLPSTKWRYLKVKAIHNATDIFFRYEWTDSTADLSVGDSPLFADAVAMEIPFTNPSSIAMGNQREPVNILYWRADLLRPQNIVSGGTGTVQKSPDSDLLPIAHSQSRVNGAWTVIIKRPLQGPAVDTKIPPQAPGNLVSLARNKNYRICFAQWNGAAEERNSLKMVAGGWQTLFVQ